MGSPTDAARESGHVSGGHTRAHTQRCCLMLGPTRIFASACRRGGRSVEQNDHLSELTESQSQRLCYCVESAPLFQEARTAFPPTQIRPWKAARKMCAVVPHNLGKGARLRAPVASLRRGARRHRAVSAPSKRLAVSSPRQGASMLPETPWSASCR